MKKQTIQVMGLREGESFQRGDIALWSENDPISMLIRWVTGCRFDHVEIINSPVTSIGAKIDGVKIRSLPNVRKDITIVAMHLSDEAWTTGYAWLQNQLGTKYDLTDFFLNAWAIFRPNGPFPKTPQKYTCSELAGTFLKEAGVGDYTSLTEAGLQVESPCKMASRLGVT